MHDGLRSTYIAHCGVGVNHIRGMAPFRGAAGEFEKFDHALNESEIAELAKTMPIPKIPAETAPVEFTRRPDHRILAQAWAPGDYNCKTADGKSLQFNICSLPEPLI